MRVYDVLIISCWHKREKIKPKILEIGCKKGRIATSENKHTLKELKEMQSWPLERKIAVSQTKIIEWFLRHNGAVTCNFSGGKDSTVLLDLVRRCYPDVEAIYVDTGLCYPEVRNFAINTPNTTVIKPKLCKVCTDCIDGCFASIINNHGWCYPSKDVARTLRYAAKGSAYAVNRVKGLNKDGTPSWFKETRYKKWAFLLDSGINISDICCEIMKERPLDKYMKQTGKMPFIGTMASESNRRKQSWLRVGCNAFEKRKPSSQPLSFWVEDNILRYLRDFKIPYASVYGDIVAGRNGKLRTTGEKRTGCTLCPIGCHLDKESRFKRLAVSHPELYYHVIHELDLKRLLDYVGVEY